MNEQFEFNALKFKELVLYLAERSKTDPGFASTKLNKLLFYCDFEAYRVLGHPITGASYEKLQWGPAAREFLPMQDELLWWDDAAIEHRERGPYTQVVTIALREPDMEIFSIEEREVIDEILAALRPLDARGVSELSHEHSAGWNLTPEGQLIPYESALISTRRPPAVVFDHFRRLHSINS